MKIRESQMKGLVTLSLDGHLDGENYRDLELRISETFQQGGIRLILDLAELSYVSSAGLRVILAAAKRCNAAGGELRVAALKPQIQEIFELSGLSQVISVDETVDASADQLAHE